MRFLFKRLSGQNKYWRRILKVKYNNYENNDIFEN